MQVKFRTRTLENQYTTSAKAIKAYGEQVGIKYIERINIIKSAKDLDELCRISILKCHPLKGNLKNLWSMKLTGFMRLIFSLEGDTLEIAKIEEVSKHYGD